jgi:hypothetical protein
MDSFKIKVQNNKIRLFVLASIVICIFIGFFLYNYINSNVKNTATFNKGTYGDLISGTFGVTLTFLSILLIIITNYIQVENNRFNEIFNLQESFNRILDSINSEFLKLNNSTSKALVVSCNESFKEIWDKAILLVDEKEAIIDAEIISKFHSRLVECKKYIQEFSGISEKSAIQEFKGSALFDPLYNMYLYIIKLNLIDLELSKRSRIYENTHHNHIESLIFHNEYRYIYKAFNINNLYYNNGITIYDKLNQIIYLKLLGLPNLSIDINIVTGKKNSWEIKINNLGKEQLIVYNLELEEKNLFPGHFKLEIPGGSDKDFQLFTFDNEINEVAKQYNTFEFEKCYLKIIYQNKHWSYRFKLNINNAKTTEPALKLN